MNRSLDKNTPVAISRAEAYEFDSVFSIIKKHFSLILADNDLIKNKNVVIKPNLLLNTCYFQHSNMYHGTKKQSLHLLFYYRC